MPNMEHWRFPVPGSTGCQPVVVGSLPTTPTRFKQQTDFHDDQKHVEPSIFLKPFHGINHE